MFFFLYIFSCFKIARWEYTYKEFLSELLSISRVEPNINYYLLIGPKSAWMPMFEETNLLKMYRAASNIFLDFTI